MRTRVFEAINRLRRYAHIEDHPNSPAHQDINAVCSALERTEINGALLRGEFREGLEDLKSFITSQPDRWTYFEQLLLENIYRRLNLAQRIEEVWKGN